MGHWNTKEGIMELLYRLVKVPSVTGTRGELRMEDEISAILKEMPYFQKYPDQIYRKEITGDLLNRKAVAAFYQGSKTSKKTIILLSHYDVVGVEDYGRLAPLAFSPLECTSAMAEENLSVDAEQDLKSGEWIFGRGIMDMKAGLAIQMALLSEAAEHGNLKHNLLFLATPDEERYSAGMFAGVELIKGIKDQYQLDLEVAICSEPSFGAYPGDRTKYFYTGSVGKLLPLIFCVGTETHVGEPLEGMNAAWMAGVIAERLELSLAFLEQERGEQNPLPTILKLMDLKEAYNVQTPTAAYVLANILTLKQSPEEVINKLKDIGEESSRYIEERLSNIYDLLGYGRHGSRKSILKPSVYTYQELYDKGCREYGHVFIKEINAKIALLEQDAGMNMAKLTAEIADVVAAFFKSEAPFYMIMLAPPYYPHVYLENDERDQKAKGIVDQCVRIAKEKFNEEIKIMSYFPGLSDVSYCRLHDRDLVMPVLENEMPLYGKGYNLPLSIIGELDIPAVNIGPYGKDAHKRTERLHIPFSTEVVPKLLKQVVYGCQ